MLGNSGYLTICQLTVFTLQNLINIFTITIDNETYAVWIMLLKI